MKWCMLKSRDITLSTKVHLSQGYGFSSGHVWMWELDYKEGWAPKNWCFWTMLLEKTLESPLDCKEIQSVHPKVLDVHWKDWCWRWNANTLATWCGELTHWKRPWCWEGLGAGGEGDDKGWDGWMASPTQWTWVWVDSGSWWWTGRPGVLPFMGLQRVDMTERLNWTELNWWDWMPWSSFFECWVLSQLFHSPFSPSSRGSLVLLCFLPLRWCHLLIWGYWYFSW